MKKILLYAMVMTFAIFTACKKDDDAKKLPILSADPVSVAINDKVEITFNYTAEAGFKSASVTPAEATITTDGVAGATSGAIVVEYTAGTTIGAATVSLTVTDNDGQQTTFGATVDVKSGISVTSNISENTTWETGKVYILEGRIAVLAGATLTIEPGVIVKGKVGTDVNASALIITRGATIMANGTSSSPIIFTSEVDEIVPGQIVSPNLLPSDNGLWGGLIILGNATSSFKADAAEVRVEGIPDTDNNGFHGSDDAANDTESSGELSYVSIRHGGSLLGEGNEINGLTLGSVGSGTSIHHIEVIGNKDDGIEWFGGTVNVSHVVVWNAGDDAIDTDMSWRGTLDNFVIINPTNSCFELDGPEGSTRIGDLNHTIKNGTVKVAGTGVDLCDNDDNTNVNMNSIYFYDLDEVRTFHTMPTYANCVFADLEIAPSTLDVATYFLDGFAAYATAVDAPVNAGADLTEFDGWSWARVAGEF